MLASAQARGKATNDRRDALNRCTEVGKYPDRTLVKGKRTPSLYYDEWQSLLDSESVYL